MGLDNFLSPDSIVMRSGDLLDSAIDDETVVLSIKNSKYYGMDAVASRIWQLIEKPISIGEIIKTLVQEYDVTADTCEADLAMFIDKMLQENLIKISNEHDK